MTLANLLFIVIIIQLDSVVSDVGSGYTAYFLKITE